ncbi:fatty acid desaturase [Petrocella sp. FN5]|uniref:fatty acid desaturase n=1 Tax=Petrocella sp. FN5 TaxID=3032002 RepID=UPI0023DB2180|nr:fatty acid desaturase [Petrocella sp. FN5]MDF1616762.1 fatty acid desaturase [Petrocella sp. FN5]
MSRKEWNIYLKDYAKADHKKVILQMLNTVLPYILILVSIFYLASQGTKFIILFPMSIVASALMVRTFIFFHDCTHQSYIGNSKGNQGLGNFLGILVFTPYEAWKKEHNIHHGTVGNLDEKGVGDIWTMTSKEYEAASKFDKMIYRIFRNPAFLFTIAPIFLFTVLQRIPKKTATKKERKNYVLVNSILLVYALTLSFLFGWQVFITYQLLILGMAASVGVWLFYVQHQFEEVYWAGKEDWDLVDAALEGSSYYKLPAILEWISGYIGYHHIHHLNARIPNYNLKACYKSNVKLQGNKTVRFIESFKLAFLFIYNENEKRMMSYKTYKSYKAQNNPA